MMGRCFFYDNHKDIDGESRSKMTTRLCPEQQILQIQMPRKHLFSNDFMCSNWLGFRSTKILGLLLLFIVIEFDIEIDVEAEKRMKRSAWNAMPIK